MDIVLIILKRERSLNNSLIPYKKLYDVLKRSSEIELKDIVEQVEIKNFEDLNRAILSCKRCAISKTINNYVIGEGSTDDCNIMFIGEAPGEEEDKRGIPFVGRAGKLLREIIDKKGITEKYYITNIIKCRPPGNRNPEIEEIRSCSVHLDFQIQTIDPTVICALGTFAAQKLLDTDERIGSLRGKVLSANGRLIIPTYHPSYILRNPSMKGVFESDIELVRMKMGG